MNGRDRSTINRDKIPELQHRHFCFIAAVLAESRPMANWDANKHAQWQSVLNSFVAACKRSNGRFDADRFIEACNHSSLLDKFNVER
jgi:hypothetical protein